MAEQTVFVKFVTQLDQAYAVKKDPISVPDTLKRLGLSRLINHLLGSDAKPTPFDFLIHKKLLRSSLKTFIAKHLPGDENIIEIEYILALGVSENDSGFQHDDWVSALDKHQHKLKTGLIASGSYDNVVRFWPSGKLSNPPEEPSLRLEGHDGPIKCITSAAASESEISQVTGSQDQTLKLWKINAKSNKAKCEWTMVGHTGSIEDCDIDSDGKYVVSASWDSTIKLWDLLIAEKEPEPVVVPTTKDRTKRRRAEADVPKNLKKSTATFLGHKQPVCGVQWIANEEIVSASFDHSVRFWNVESTTETLNLTGNTAIYGLSTSSQNNNLVVTAHADRTVRMWDKRAHQNVASILASHKGWVSCVAFHPSNPEMFLSGAYDNTVKVWDARSSTPLHTIHAHTNKVLAVGWVDDQVFVSGGADSLLKMHKLIK